MEHLNIYLNSKDRRKLFSKEVEEIGQQEDFTYSIFEFASNHGEGWCGRYENGEWINLEERYSQDIVDKDFGEDWWCWNQDLFVGFDYEKHPDILEALHNCVRKNVPSDQIEYCEGTWEDGEVGILCVSISWFPRKLRVVQDFLDQLNDILRPIIEECDGYAEGNWYIRSGPIAIASWNWTENGFVVKGTVV